MEVERIYKRVWSLYIQPPPGKIAHILQIASYLLCIDTKYKKKRSWMIFSNSGFCFISSRHMHAHIHNKCLKWMQQERRSKIIKKKIYMPKETETEIKELSRKIKIYMLRKKGKRKPEKKSCYKNNKMYVAEKSRTRDFGKRAKFSKSNHDLGYFVKNCTIFHPLFFSFCLFCSLLHFKILSDVKLFFFACQIWRDWVILRDDRVKQWLMTRRQIIN